MKSIQTLIQIVTVFVLLTKMNQASRKSTIKRNCILFDTKENHVVHADINYKLSKTKINHQEQKEKIKTNVSYWIQMENCRRGFITLTDFKSNRKLCFLHKNGSATFMDEQFYNKYKLRCHWKELKVYRKNPVYNHHYELRYINQRYPGRYLSWRNFNKVFTRKSIKDYRKNPDNETGRLYGRRKAPIGFNKTVIR